MACTIRFIEPYLRTLDTRAAYSIAKQSRRSYKCKPRYKNKSEHNMEAAKM